MNRLLGLLLSIAVLVIVALAMVRSCASHPGKPVAGAVSPSGDSDIVALRDRSTLHVPKGTVGRDLVDWLARSDATPATFELAGQQFVGRSAEPTPELIGRASRLVAVLRAHPEVSVTIVGHTAPSADAVADQALSLARAQRLVQLLASDGIRPARLKA
jgi:outer membrane protein OmpA-like peptidoglycan-associated protein